MVVFVEFILLLIVVCVICYDLEYNTPTEGEMAIADALNHPEDDEEDI